MKQGAIRKFLCCVRPQDVDPNPNSAQKRWVCSSRLKLPAIQELIEGGQLEANCCKYGGAVFTYAENHSDLIKPIVDAFPDPRQLALDRWEESGEKLPPNAKPAAR